MGISRLGMKNANADVESAHSLIESEFYDIEDFGSKAEFFRKAQLYQDFFNMIRPNFSKGTKTPWEIISEDRPDIATEVLLFPMIDIDALFRFKFSMTQRGQIIPAFAGAKTIGTLRWLLTGMPKSIGRFGLL